MGVMTWRWRTCADPNRPAKTERIAHPLAGRFGQECEIVAQGRNGNRLLRFDDGFLVVAPLYAARSGVAPVLVALTDREKELMTKARAKGWSS